VIVIGRSVSACLAAKRSEKIRAINKATERVALTVDDIFSPAINETSVSTREATKSRLLTGVTGGAGFGSFFFQVQKDFFSPTGSPQM
jgi:hypothetical protein